MTDKDEKILMFMELTSSNDAEEALLLLEQNGWDLENSVNSYFVIHDDDNNKHHTSSSSLSSRIANPSASSSSKFNDYDDDETFVDVGNHHNMGGEDDIRAPIPTFTETLVQGDTYDQFVGRSFPQQRRKPANINPNNNPFESFRNFQAEQGYQPKPAATVSYQTPKQVALAELFKPPLDILSFGSFDQVKKKAEQMKLNLLVNLQDVTEFDCQKMNRDTWSDKNLKQFVSSHFVFWQVSRDSNEGAFYCRLYPVIKFPHIAIIDGRTGRNIATREGFLDSIQATNFLQGFIQSNNDTNNSEVKRKRNTEEDELEKAIQLSLQGSKTTTTKDEKLNVDDDDDDDDNDDDQEEEEDQDIDEDDDYNLGKYEKKEVVVPHVELNDTIGTIGDCVIQIKLPDGNNLRGNFLAGDRIQKLYYYVTLKAGLSSNKFVLMTTFPKLELTGEHVNKTLEDHNLTPRAMLIAKAIDD